MRDLSQHPPVQPKVHGGHAVPVMFIFGRASARDESRRNRARAHPDSPSVPSGRKRSIEAEPADSGGRALGKECVVYLWVLEGVLLRQNLLLPLLHGNRAAPLFRGDFHFRLRVRHDGFRFGATAANKICSLRVRLSQMSPTDFCCFLLFSHTKSQLFAFYGFNSISLHFT